MAALLTLMILPWLLYSHTLKFESVLDDQEYVLVNPLIHESRSFHYPHDFKAFIEVADKLTISTDYPVNFILRPVSYFTFYLNRCYGGVETASYRIVNISIHMMNGMLLFLLTHRLLGRTAFSASLALSAALLFVVHPLATESVTYITQRFESLATLFCLAALLLHLLARASESKAMRLLLVAGGLLATLLAMFSKETGAVIPLLLLLLEVFYFRQTLWSGIKSVRWHLLLLPILPALVLACHWALKDNLNPLQALNITNSGLQTYSITDYALTQVCAWLSYLRLLLFPVGQNFDHDYPLITTPWDVHFLTSILTILMLLAAAYYLHRRSGSSRLSSLPLCGLLWFFITLAPSSSFIPLPDLFAEHRSYLPSIGITFALAAIIHLWVSQSPTVLRRAAIMTVMGFCAVLLSLATLLRNEVMRNRESLWTDTLAKGTNKARVWKGLGIAAVNAGRPDKALSYFKHAAENFPRDLECWLNLCSLHLKMSQCAEAEATSQQAIKIHGNVVLLLHLHALSLGHQGRWQEGEKIWKVILSQFPDDRNSHLCLAEIYLNNGQPQIALRHLRSGEKSGPLDTTFGAIKQQLESQIASLP